MNRSMKMCGVGFFSLLLASCSNHVTIPPTYQNQFINSAKMAPCGKPPIARVFKVEVPDSLDLPSANQVKTNTTDNLTNEDDDTITTPVVSTDGKNAGVYNKNPYHIDLASYEKGDKKHWFEIRVVNEGSRYGFYSTPKDDPVPGIVGVAYGISKYDHSSHFCTDGLIHDKSEVGYSYPTVVFYVRQNDGKSSKYESGYNILLFAPNAPSTPLIIDPKIQNNG